MSVKIAALGFYDFRGRAAYLNDNWNRMDFVVVVLSLLQYVGGLGNFTALRPARCPVVPLPSTVGPLLLLLRNPA